MKWWMLIILRGLAIGGPYDTLEECRSAIKTEQSQPILDPGFDNARRFCLCFQGTDKPPEEP